MSFSVARDAGRIHLGLDTSKNSIAVGILRPDEVSPDAEKIFNDEASVRRLIDRSRSGCAAGVLRGRAARVQFVPAAALDGSGL
jgi:hypothetical protein